MTTAASTTPPADAPAGVALPSTRAWRERGRVGDIVVELGFAQREEVEQAVVQALASGRPVGQVLVESGTVSLKQLARALAERNGMPFIDLDVFEVDRGAANLISTSQARHHQALPISFLDERTVLIATSNPANIIGLDDIALLTGYDGRLAITSPESLGAVIEQLGSLSETVPEIVEHSEPERSKLIGAGESAEQAPVAKLVRAVISDAVAGGASDIHFDPCDGGMRVRERVDGIVSDTTTVPAHLVPGLVSGIKIMAELDIAERRLPQEGRVGLTIDGRPVDLRVAMLPTTRGESAVIQVFDKDRVFLDLEQLGMGPPERARLEHAMGQAHGAILVTGPAGAGKTTTLCATLDALNTPDRTVISIEDPVEYELDGVKQVQVDPGAGLTFASGLRSMIHSDPDVIMIGEIRDPETAQVAIESALTGHLVLANLHATSAPLAAARLIEMGIEPFLIASGLRCVVAQGLARRLCEECRQPVRLTGAELESIGFGGHGEDVDAFEPGGCRNCHGTGFVGRIGIYEVMAIDDEVRSLIVQRAGAAEISEAARRAGMRTIAEVGFEKIQAGVTSASEVLRVLGA